MIEVRNLSKYFRDKKRGEIRAVDDVSFRCLPGQIYGLLGANGAGKTTTLRMLATILEPTGGTAIVCGHDIVEHPEKVRADVGFLSTATALYPRLTARELSLIHISMVPPPQRCPRKFVHPNIAAISATASFSIADVARPPSSAWLLGLIHMARAYASRATG